jgi:hypothetical protein
VNHRLDIEPNAGINVVVSAIRLLNRRLAGDVEFMLVVPVGE